MWGKSDKERRSELNTIITTNRFKPQLGSYVLDMIRTKWEGLTADEKMTIAGQCGLGTKKGSKKERDYRRLALAVRQLQLRPFPGALNPESLKDAKKIVKRLPIKHVSAYIRRRLPSVADGAKPYTVPLFRKNAEICWSKAAGSSSGKRFVALAHHHVVRPGDVGHGLVKSLMPAKYFSEKQNQYSKYKGIWDVTPKNGRRIKIYPAVPSAMEPFGAHTSLTQPNPPVANSLKAYYLPWEPGWCVKYKIPANARNNSLFLTSALSGCSIIVRGPATNPTVYHCGMYGEYWGSAKAAKLAMDRKIASPRAVLEHGLAIREAIKAKEAHALFEATVRQEGDFDSFIQSSDYAKGKTKCRVCSNPKSTVEMSVLHKKIQKQAGNARLLAGNNGFCSGFGMAYGVKKNGNWAFYLQGGINLSIISSDGLHKWIYIQPTSVQQFYPDKQIEPINLMSGKLDFLNEDNIDFKQNA